MKASTAASNTSAASPAPPVAGTRCSGIPDTARPRKNSTVAGSSNAYTSASPSTTPSTPVFPRRSERATASGPG